MSTGINILCYKSKTLANGEHPLMLRVCKDGKKKYISLGLSIAEQYWDFTKNKPKLNCPNKEYIETLIANKTKEFNEKVIEFKSEDKEFTARTLIEKVSKPTKKKTVGEFFLEQIEQLKIAKRTGYAKSHYHVYNSLMKFNGHLDIYFSDIDIPWLKKYEEWQRANGDAENSIGIRFRTLRVIYNHAIEENLVKEEYYPFRKFKISRLHEVTAKRAIVKEEVMQIINYNYIGKDLYIHLAIDLFSFSYFMGGINFIDMAYLTHENIIDSRLIYRRKKTRKLIKLPLLPKASEIIDKYKTEGSPFLFPILSTFHQTEIQQRNRIHKTIVKVNRRLKNIGKELGIDKKLTTYVARHSHATTLKRAGVSTSIISEALGHSSEKVTQIYLDSFENTQMSNAMQNLL